MSTLFQRARAAFSAFWNAFSDPESEQRDIASTDRQTLYRQAWMYYRSQMFSRRNGTDWNLYLASRELYKHARLIYNPVPQIVDFYVDNIWQPAHDEEVEALVTPVSEGTDDNLKLAIAQLDQWGNFLAEGQKIKRYAAATGNVLIEVDDDLEREKVLHKTVWPGHVADIELNSTGDVQGYTLEFPVVENNRRFTFKKVVTKESFSYFRDNAPFIPEGKTASVEENPYPFVPAVWIRHTDDGAPYGLPACKDFDKVDEANSLGSHLHDNIHKLVESPVVISAEGEIVPIVGAASRTDPITGEQEVVPADPRLNWVVFKTKAGASVHDLASKLKLAEAHPYLKDLLASFPDDYPELQADSIVRENSQLSGAALERMLGPAQNRLDGVQANYNQQWVKLRQMQIAIAGERYKSTWTERTEQQALFAPFGFDSYAAGTLDFSVKRSVLVKTTEMEDAELLFKKAEVADKLKGIVDTREQLKVAGYSDDEIEEIMQRKEAEPQPTVTPLGIPPGRQLGNGSAEIVN